MSTPFLAIFFGVMQSCFALPIAVPPYPHRLHNETSARFLKTTFSPSYPSRQHHRRRATSFDTLRNLVIPIRFADHIDRHLPSPSDLDVVFNSIEGDDRRDVLAPTGSVREVFLANSYGKFEVISTVLDYVNVSQTEFEASGGAYGMSPALLDSLYEALAMANVAHIDLDDFDSDQDGFIDAVTFIHSGYMAEWGGLDCYGIDERDRIWSHKWAIPPDLLLPAQGPPAIHMDSYIIAAAVWGKCDSEIARIGLLAHELAHFLGIEDLYDTSPEQKGRGLGAYDTMSDTWGLDYSQLYPPMMSAWTKIHLGWLEPTVITTAGKYSLDASATAPAVYRIDEGFPEGEYVLIENRQAIGFDALISQGGLAIYHIDEEAPWQKRRGYPYQDEWPENGNHYMVALLQADGKYDLERGKNTGDSGDLWHAYCGRATLGPGKNNTDNTTLVAVYPNSDSYQDGNIKSTGIVISDISESGQVMSFWIESPHLKEAYTRSEAVSRHPDRGEANIPNGMNSKANISDLLGDIVASSEDAAQDSDALLGNSSTTRLYLPRGTSFILAIGAVASVFAAYV